MLLYTYKKKTNAIGKVEELNKLTFEYTTVEGWTRRVIFSGVLDYCIHVQRYIKLAEVRRIYGEDIEATECHEIYEFFFRLPPTHAELQVIFESDECWKVHAEAFKNYIQGGGKCDE